MSSAAVARRVRRARRLGIAKRPPVLVPYEYWPEVMKLSKAALADMAWDLVAVTCQSADDQAEVIASFRGVWATVSGIREEVRRRAARREER
jgi:DNA-binding Lrp family transcriptional regulator